MHKHITLRDNIVRQTHTNQQAKRAKTNSEVKQRKNVEERERQKREME